MVDYVVIVLLLIHQTALASSMEPDALTDQKLQKRQKDRERFQLAALGCGHNETTDLSQ